MAEFWLYRWMDEFDVKSNKDVGRLLCTSNRKALEALDEIASQETWRPLEAHAGSPFSLVAGRGIDLSGDLDCCHRVCQTRQVDQLFGRVLHYFDEIVVAGPPAHRFAGQIATGDEHVLHNLAEHVATLLYLRRIGAAEMLTFVQKPPACAQHYLQHAEEAGLTSVVEHARPWAQHLLEAGEIVSLRRHDDHWDFQFNHPDLEHSVWDAVAADGDARPEPSAVVDVVFARYLSHLVSDVATARGLSLPLGASIQVHEDLLGLTNRPPRADDVAFELNLPVLSELPVRDVIRLRADETEYFLKFRDALEVAIRERLAAGESARDAASKIEKEIIEPALNDIAARLRSAERAVDRKIGAAIGFGAVAATVGVIGGAPLVVGAGVAAMGTSVSAAQKYFDDKGSVELADMYFLWRLETLAAKHKH